MFPLVVAAALSYAWANALWRAGLVLVALVWSTRASVVFMRQLVPERRQALAVYPVALFYVMLAWLVFVQ